MASGDFEHRMLPHLGAAYSLARWLLRNPHDAEDAVQEAMLRAFKSYATYAGGSPKAWLLAIVRNTCMTAIERRRAEGKVVVLQDVLDERERGRPLAAADPSLPADDRLVLEEDRRRVHAAIAALPPPFREVLVLREFHDLGYREIADVVGAPIGTVMSRLARARDRLREQLAEPTAASGTEHKS